MSPHFYYRPCATPGCRQIMRRPFDRREKDFCYWCERERRMVEVVRPETPDQQPTPQDYGVGITADY